MLIISNFANNCFLKSDGDGQRYKNYIRDKFLYSLQWIIKANNFTIKQLIIIRMQDNNFIEMQFTFHLTYIPNGTLF